mgnify:CR=1 FL=1
MAKSQLNDKERKNDSKIFDAYLNCEIALKRFIRRFYSKSEDIDDLAQEAFLRAFNVELRQEIKSPKAYLFRVARNIALRELGKKSRQLTDYLEDVVDGDSLGKEASIEEEIAAQQKLKHCCNAIADLPEQCRRVFIMRKVYARSHKEIAAELGISNRTVEKHITKGIDRFTTYMEGQEPTALEPTASGIKTKYPWS